MKLFEIICVRTKHRGLDCCFDTPEKRGASVEELSDWPVDAAMGPFLVSIAVGGLSPQGNGRISLRPGVCVKGS